MAFHMLVLKALLDRDVFSTGAKGTKVEAELCGCKYSNTKPYCDGTHKSLKADFDKMQANK